MGLNMVHKNVAEISRHADSGSYDRQVPPDTVHHFPVDVDMGTVGRLRVGQKSAAIARRGFSHFSFWVWWPLNLFSYHLSYNGLVISLL